MLDLMRDIILATDLAHHLRIFKDLQKMAEGDAGLLAPLVSWPLVPMGFCHLPLSPWGFVTSPCPHSVLSCPHWVVSCPLVPMGLCRIPIGLSDVPLSPLDCVMSPCPHWVVLCPHWVV